MNDLISRITDLYDDGPYLQTAVGYDAASYEVGAHAGWDAAIKRVLELMQAEQADALPINLMWRNETRRRIMQEMVKNTVTLPDVQPPAAIETSMERVATVFSADNLRMLATLRSLGHISLDAAAEAFGCINGANFLESTVTNGLFHYLDVMALPDGTPGVRVPYTKVLIDLDIEK